MNRYRMLLERTIAYGLSYIVILLLLIHVQTVTELTKEVQIFYALSFSVFFYGSVMGSCIHYMMTTGRIIWRLIPSLFLQIGGPILVVWSYKNIPIQGWITSAPIAEGLCQLLKGLCVAGFAIGGGLPSLMQFYAAPYFLEIGMRPACGILLAILISCGFSLFCGWLVGHLLVKKVDGLRFAEKMGM